MHPISFGRSGSLAHRAYGRHRRKKHLGMERTLVPFLRGRGLIRLVQPCATRRQLTSNSAVIEGLLVANDEVRSFIERCMTAAGAKAGHGAALADNLVTADYRGHFSHGLNRLEIYVKDIQACVTESEKEPVILHESPATAFVEGNNVLGPVVGNYCNALAMKKAKEAGVGWIVAKGSNHYGIAGYYSMKACEQGFLGMSFTNTSPLVLPTRGKKKIFGTNPISLAAPGKHGDSFVLDMATATAALGKIELADVKQQAVPRGFGADKAGKETLIPGEILDGGGQFFLGGSETTGGYKGYGLGMMVEIFCGMLSGSKYGPNIRSWRDTKIVADLGQCFIAINPDMFAPGFSDRMQDLMDICRGQEPAEGETEVLVAGDPERKHMAKCDSQGGICYHRNQITNSHKIADSLNVKRIQVLE